MKKTLLTLSLVVAATAAFAQGKVNLANDVNSPFKLDANVAKLYAADAALAGLAIPTTGALPSGKILTVGLYGGTGATLTLQGKIDLNPAGGSGYDAGTITPTKIICTGIPGGSVANFQVRVWENTFANYEAATTGYVGQGALFTMIPGAGIAYPNTYNGGSTTWQAGAISVAIVPEPSTMALAGLGAAALLIFRRRK